jgi:fatty acid hydroxylase family protein
MPLDDPIRAQWKAFGLRVKRRNLLAAALSGLVLACISLRLFPHSAAGLLFGFFTGLLYANTFEYCVHRFLLHAGRGFFGRQHMVHHTTLNSPEAPRYVNFSRNPWGVVALFLVNAIPFLILEWIARNGWAAGMFVSFAIYYIAFEEIHWRTHMGGWMPKWLRPAARHHLLHHTRESGRFNVFLPAIDWLLGPPAKPGVEHRPQNELRSRP